MTTTVTHNQFFEDTRESTPTGLRREMDRKACSSSLWLAMYTAQLSGWTDIEHEIFDLAFRVDCRIRQDAA